MFHVFQNMKNQNSIYRLENFGINIQKLLRLYVFTLIALLTHSCNGEASGQVINTTMFEIPSKDQKSYMLRDCRKMAGDDIDCKCAYLGRECQQADVENCRNCSCLDGSTRIFYVKKRYGAVCLSQNNIFNAGKFMFLCLRFTYMLATTKKRYSDTTIQRYRNRNLEPEPGTVHNLCKLEHFAPQEIYIIIIYRGGGGRNSMIV